jgi:hypothetical protein
MSNPTLTKVTNEFGTEYEVSIDGQKIGTVRGEVTDVTRTIAGTCLGYHAGQRKRWSIGYARWRKTAYGDYTTRKRAVESLVKDWERLNAIEAGATISNRSTKFGLERGERYTVLAHRVEGATSYTTVDNNGTEVVIENVMTQIW